MSDIAVVMVGDEEDMVEAEEEGEGVVVGYAMGFKTRSMR